MLAFSAVHYYHPPWGPQVDNEEPAAVFVWIFHRISGVLLIFLMVLQLATGLVQSGPGASETAQAMAKLHQNTAVNSLLVFLFIFHALYGIRTMLLDLGCKREKLLFWICTNLGLLLFVAFLILYWTLARA